MPEGPEIRRAADTVAKAVEGQVAEEVWFAFDHLRPYGDVLGGSRVTEVATRGKAMLTRFATGLSVYTHNQLYGRWEVCRPGEARDTRRQLRFAIHTPNRSALLYSASEIEVLDREAEGRHPYLSRLGPDVVSQAPAPDELAARLAERRFRGRQLGALLLDQGFVAGLGNYLRAEILFEAGVHPRRRAADCSASEHARIGERMVGLARRAYATAGVTLPRDLSERLKQQGTPWEERRFWVFRRAGQPCRRCGAPVHGELVGGRSCFWCPRCQPA